MKLEPDVKSGQAVVPKSPEQNHQSKIDNQQSKIVNHQSKIVNPQSKIVNPQSSIQNVVVPKVLVPKAQSVWLLFSTGNKKGKNPVLCSSQRFCSSQCRLGFRMVVGGLHGPCIEHPAYFFNMANIAANHVYCSFVVGLFCRFHYFAHLLKQLPVIVQ